MIIANIMKKNPICVTPDMSLTDVRAIMAKEGVGKIPVLDKNENLVGIITKKDLMKADPSLATTLDVYEIGYLLSKLRVEKIMVKDVAIVKDTEVIEEAARIMADKDISCLPVMKGSSVVGIVTQRDLFSAFVTMFGARYKGVRATFELDEKPGQIANLAQAIADLNCNIVSLVTNDGHDAIHRRCTCKVEGISIEQLTKIMGDVGAVLEDIR